VFVSQEYSGWGMKLTIHLHLVQNVKKWGGGAHTPTFPCMPSWHDSESFASLDMINKNYLSWTTLLYLFTNEMFRRS
jgi:hypothetical protein